MHFVNMLAIFVADAGFHSERSIYFSIKQPSNRLWKAVTFDTSQCSTWILSKGSTLHSLNAVVINVHLDVMFHPVMSRLRKDLQYEKMLSMLVAPSTLIMLRSSAYNS